MDSYRRTSIVVGLLILAAYGVLVSLFTESLPKVVFFELMSGTAVIFIAVLMVPLFKPLNKKLTLGYLASKVVEGGLMIVASILLLSGSSVLLKIRELIYTSHAYFFIVASMLFYYLLFQSKLIPRFISVWGVIALISLLIGNLLEIAGNTHPLIMLFYPLIMINEVFMAIWLIVKGFNLPVIDKGEKKWMYT